MLSDKKNRAIYDQYGAEGLREGVCLLPCASFGATVAACFQSNEFPSELMVPTDRVLKEHAIVDMRRVAYSIQLRGVSHSAQGSYCVLVPQSSC